MCARWRARAYFSVIRVSVLPACALRTCVRVLVHVLFNHGCFACVLACVRACVSVRLCFYVSVCQSVYAAISFH
jgi:hypothetical protein